MQDTKVSLKTEDWGLINYNEAWEKQKYIFSLVTEEKKLPQDKHISNTLVFCEHPHVYTLGKNGNASNLLVNEDFLAGIGAELYYIERGGDVTYHGPGQLVGYPIINLEDFGLGLRSYIEVLEETIIHTLLDFGIKGERFPGATGVWLDSDIAGKARKICAIGVKASRYVTMHGFGFNINTDLSYFSHINPCGFTDKGVTSLKKEIGEQIDMSIVKTSVERHFRKILTN